MPDKSIQNIPISELAMEDKELIKSRKKIPAGGKIVDETSSINESKPIKKSKGESAVGGTINGEGSLTLQVKNLVKETQNSKSKTQDFANQVAL